MLFIKKYQVVGKIKLHILDQEVEVEVDLKLLIKLNKDVVCKLFSFGGGGRECGGGNSLREVFICELSFHFLLKIINIIPWSCSQFFF